MTKYLAIAFLITGFLNWLALLFCDVVRWVLPFYFRHTVGETYANLWIYMQKLRSCVWSFNV